MDNFMQSVDTILWGRKTYAKGAEMGMKAAGFGLTLKNYVFRAGRKSRSYRDLSW